MADRARLYRTIHWQAPRLDLDEEGLRDAMEAITGKRSKRKCTVKELLAIVEDFKERGAVPSRSAGKGRPGVGSRRPIKNKRPGSIVRMVTQAQRDLIEELCRKKGISPEYLKSLCWKNFRKDYPQTTAEAGNIITLLLNDEKVKKQNGRKEVRA